MAGLARQRHRAVVIVTHDSRVLHYGDRIVRIQDGTIHENIFEETEAAA